MRGLLPIVALSLGSCLWAGEYAVFNSGSRLHVGRHSTDGAQTTLYQQDGGYTVVPTEQITGFEAEDYAPPPAPPPAAAPPPPAGDLNSLVDKAAREHGLRPELVQSVIAAESGYNPAAISPKGALGLMQLMPATARDLQVANPLDAAQNVEGGTAYLRQLLDRYASFENQLERAVAAYNAGPAKVDRYGGLPPYRETIDFVSRVSSQLLRLTAGP